MDALTRHRSMHPLLWILLLLGIMTLGTATSTHALSGKTLSIGPASDASALTGATEGSVLFIENEGQWDAAAFFQVWGGPGDAMWIGRDGSIWLTVLEESEAISPEQGLLAAERDLPARPLRGVHIKLTFENANPRARVEPFAPRDTVVSYFYGDDPAGWRPHVPVWGGVRYRDLYPGVDLILTGEKGRGFVWRMACQGPCDQALGQVRLRVEGAESLSLDEAGALILHTAVGDLRLPLLLSPNGAPDVEPIIEGDLVAMPLTTMQQDAFLQVTEQGPGLLFGTYIGGKDQDYVADMDMDLFGDVYVTGHTSSTDFPVTWGSFDPTYQGGVDVFVLSLDSLGGRLRYATFIGGTKNDLGYGIDVDLSGNAYVTGETWSSDFPITAKTFDRTHNGLVDAFFLKLNNQGSDLAVASFLGGNSYDTGEDIAVTSQGEIVVLGDTYSSNFPTRHAYASTIKGKNDLFIAKFSPAGNAMRYGTYLGGSDFEWGESLVVGGDGTAYVTGITKSDDFPTTALDRTYNRDDDAFIAAIGAEGDQLVFSTYWGGSRDDRGEGIAWHEATETLYVIGETDSPDFPVSGRYDYHGGISDAFYVALKPKENLLVRSLQFGGSGAEWGRGIAVDGSGSVYLTGFTSSNDMPLAGTPFQDSYEYNDLFIARFAPDGELRYSTYFGGSGREGFNEITHASIAVTPIRDVIVAGYTSSNDFPVTEGAFDRTFNGRLDAFVVKLDIIPPELEHVRASHDTIYRMGCNLDPTSTTIRAEARDVHLHKVELYYRTPLDFFNWHHKTMVHESGSTYQASLTALLALPISYYVKATDISGQSTTSSTRTLTVRDCSQLYMPLIRK